MGRPKKDRATSTIAGAEKQNLNITVKTEDDSPVSALSRKHNSGKSQKVAANGQRVDSEGRRKRPRLIIRNINFKATEQLLLDHFKEFGDISEVCLLRKPDNQLRGCGFVEFVKRTNAAKAIHKLSGRPFMGRPIAVDWAVPKGEYVRNFEQQRIGKEKKLTEEGEIKKEEHDTCSESSECNEQKGLDSDNESNDEEDDDADSDHKDIKMEKFAGNENRDFTQKQRFESHDVTEGRTVFLRNLPFAVDNDRLKEFGQQFGCVLYAVVCKDPKFDHSTGTGFIKFKDTECVTQCLAKAQNRELTLDDRTIDVSLAISRDDANKVKSEKVKKDNRNLYLLKEGLITADSPSAKGVSPSDMEKRIQLEQWKTKTLRNLTKFVSHNRLAIHNLPPSFTDKQLRELFLKHGGSKPVLIEGRIMRNLRNVDANGSAISMGHGFVAFKKHENALEALRNLNNNPAIFGPEKRPIVSFAIEDKKMLNIKKRRQERSLIKNPTWKHFKKEVQSDTKQYSKGNKQGAVSNLQKSQVGEKRKNSTTVGPRPKIAKSFMGAVAKEGEGQTIPLRKLRDQAELVRKKARLEKKKSLQKKKPERIRQPKQSKKLYEGTDTFNETVNKYKSALSSASINLSKWFE